MSRDRKSYSSKCITDNRGAGRKLATGVGHGWVPATRAFTPATTKPRAIIPDRAYSQVFVHACIRLTMLLNTS